MTTITLPARIFLIGTEFSRLVPGDRVIVVGETIIARAETIQPATSAFAIEDVLSILDRGPTTRLYIGDALAIDRKDILARTRLRRVLERAERDGLATQKKVVGTGILWSRTRAG